MLWTGKPPVGHAVSFDLFEPAANILRGTTAIQNVVPSKLVEVYEDLGFKGRDSCVVGLHAASNSTT